MKKTWFSILILILATGCDYFENSDFRVINESSKAIVIKTIIDPDDHGIRFNDSIHSVPSGGDIEFHQGRGLTGKNDIPPDYYEPLDTIPPVTRFDIFVDGKLYDTLRLRQFWKFSAREQVGTYTLTITEELLNSL
jgi:hypothetical protein